jgi:two-component system sensor histidine kinase/response regulator
LAHDLKNYLGGMNVSAGLLCRQLARFNDDRVMRLAENIFRTSAQSLAFVKEFLANAAADHGFSFNPAAINLADAAAATARQHEEVAQQKRITIHLEPPAGAVMALADGSALHQVLDNLVSNAVKFSPPSKCVFLTVRSAPSHAECVVRDEGPGFSTEDKQRMFRRYGRLSARPTGGEPSTGLGLSIVRKLVLGMGGELLCDSTPGQGAVFTVRLPRLEPN